MSCVDDMRGTSVRTVARELGLRMAPPRGASGGSIYGCPICNASTRHPSRGDRRGAIGLRRDGAGWRCHQCDLSGDALDLVSVVLAGARFPELHATARNEVLTWCERFVGGAHNTRPQQVETPPPPQPEYPPDSELLGLWSSSSAVDCDQQVTEYLSSRGIDATSVADRDLARVLPGSHLPDWARTWPDAHRIVVPLYDEFGRLRSVLARSIDRSSTRKSLAPSGFARSGLVMADGFGRMLLNSGTRPDWWPIDVDLRVVVSEGEIDFLCWATQATGTDEHGPAVYGIVSGSWNGAIASRIPDQTVVVVATDCDEAGDRYASRIVTTFSGRNVRLERWEDSARG